MKIAGAIFLSLCISLPASAQWGTFCDQVASGAARANALPRDDDRRVFDAALVRFVSNSQSTSTGAAALADTLIWKRSQKFLEQPRQYAQGRGVFAGPKWSDEEIALWEKIVISALDEAVVPKVYDAKLPERAFFAAWELMMHRRINYLYDCR
jgi:hypothetical protein